MANEPPSRCLLVVDLFSHFRFADGEALADALVATAPGMHKAFAACRRADVPMVYCNDNFGWWHLSWEEVGERTSIEGPPASAIVWGQLRPKAMDFRLLKSRHSAFYQTQLPALLNEWGARQVAVAGASTDACVLCTAVDAHVRGFEVTVLRDATAAASQTRQARAELHLEESLGLRVCDTHTWLSVPSSRQSASHRET